MHRPDHGQVVVSGQQPCDGPGRIADAAAPVLAAVRGDRDQSPGTTVAAQRLQRGGQQRGAVAQPLIDARAGGQCGIDRGIADHVHGVGCDAFAQQVGHSAGGRRKVPMRQARGEFAVLLFGKRFARVEGAQPGFDMPDRHFVVEGGLCRSQRAGGIAVHKHRTRPHAAVQRRKTFEELAVEVRQAIVAAAQWHFMLRHDAEEAVQAFGHFAVLAGVHPCHRHATPPQLTMYWCHLDDLRARAHRNQHRRGLRAHCTALTAGSCGCHRAAAAPSGKASDDGSSDTSRC